MNLRDIQSGRAGETVIAVYTGTDLAVFGRKPKERCVIRFFGRSFGVGRGAGNLFDGFHPQHGSGDTGAVERVANALIICQRFSEGG